MSEKGERQGGGETEARVEDYTGGPRASGRTSGLWPTTMDPGLARDERRDGPGPPCMVRVREGCRQRIGDRPIPMKMITTSGTE